MSNVHILYVGNDTALEVGDLRDELTGEALNSASVAVTLKDAAGANVTGGTWPLAMVYVTDSDGVYRCTLGHALSLTAGQKYTAVITANAGTGLYATWNEECVARLRR